MTRRTPQVSDLRGAAQLVTDATGGLIDLVEAMHERIARVPGLSSPAPDRRTSGITGLVYKTVRGVTQVVGGSIDSLLGLLAPALPHDDPSTDRESIVAALNGVLGDYLVASANPLATSMALRREGRALTLDRAALKTSVPDAGGKLLVLVHGLCMNDLQWSRDGHDHGAMLAHDFGYTPIYVRYNSGLHISINGRSFARQLESLIEQWPCPVERLVVLAHSMGGLVTRSAVHYGAHLGHEWPAHLTDMVFLGTPHHGAPLERAGHWIDLALDAAPYAKAFARLGKVRSAGITDLRHGALADEDWVGRDRFAHRAVGRLHLPLPKAARSYAIAASIGKRTDDLKGRLLGDGLVPLASALGRHHDPARTLAFPKSRQWVGYGMGHLELLNRDEVYRQLRRWLI